MAARERGVNWKYAGREDPDSDAKPKLGFALPVVGEKDKIRMRRYAPVRTLLMRR
jgi:hypothetical protein